MEKKLKIVGGGRTKFKKQISESSKQYLLRQAKDPYIKRAQKEGYRSRAAYKLIELNDKFNFLKSGQTIVDLGAAPGGWCQVVLDVLAADYTKIIALDVIPVEPMEGVTFIKGDFEEEEVLHAVKGACPGGVDVVLSDMAPNTTGHSATDHLRIMRLVELAAEFAKEHLKKQGAFVCKIFQGGGEQAFVKMLREYFTTVKFVKPPSSRKNSSEIFIVALGFKG